MFFISLCYLSFLLIDTSYTRRNNYDNFNIQALLMNGTRSKNFLECISDETKCMNKEDKEMKQDMVEIMATSCKNCTIKEKQKYGEAMQAVRKSMQESEVINMVVNKISDIFVQKPENNDSKS